MNKNINKYMNIFMNVCKNTYIIRVQRFDKIAGCHTFLDLKKISVLQYRKESFLQKK
jgi:hypothetical protein